MELAFLGQRRGGEEGVGLKQSAQPYVTFRDCCQAGLKLPGPSRGDIYMTDTSLQSIIDRSFYNL